MTSRPRVRRLLPVGFFLWALATTATANPIDWHDCALPAPAVSAATIRRGTFKPVRQDLDSPMELAVARLQYRPERPSPNPIIFVPGGPGQAAGLAPAALKTWQRFQQHAGWPRDLVVFDPRGTGQSRPHLTCKARENLAQCHDRLGQRQVDGLSLSAAVSDLHGLIDELNQGPAVLWAQSFGVFVVRALAARYPNDISGVILESPAPDETADGDFAPVAIQRSVDQLIASCRNTLGCRLKVPSITVTLTATLAQLQQHSPSIAYANVPERADSVAVAPADLLAGILFASYAGEAGPAIAGLLRASLTRPQALWPLIAPVWQLAQVEQDQAPAYWSMQCSLDVAPASASVTQSMYRVDVRGYLSAAIDNRPCDDWFVSDRPALSATASLNGWLVYGTSDPVSPADVARTTIIKSPALAGLAVEGAGHLPIKTRPCVLSTIADWLARSHPKKSYKLCSR